MSSVPGGSAIHSVLQSGPMQRVTQTARSAEETRRADVSRELSGIPDAVDVEIEATDADTRVHSDAGGQGGSGRTLSEDVPAESPDERVGEEVIETRRLDIRA